MGKRYKRYKNAVEAYLESEKGRRFFHVAYSVGASIVIIGALFKINHMPYGTEILILGMVTEAIIFFLSAFDTPSKDYKWEDVYPVLGDNNDFTDNADSSKPAVQQTSFPQSRVSGVGGGTVVINGNLAGGSGVSAQSDIMQSSGEKTFAGSVGGGVSLDASEKYEEQLSKMTENMQKFAEVTNSLTEVSEVLLNSFKSITDNSEGIGSNTRGYISQMESLNRNVSGLNTIYEIQLKGVSGQINTIEQINAGLDRIKHLYDGSLADSSIFRVEAEKMAQQLAELNRVYARLLQAMTVNMNMGMGGFGGNGQQVDK